MRHDDTTRAGVNWWDIEGPHSAETRLTVAWLDERNEEMAYTFRGMHAYWMAQVFKARDARIKALETERDRLQQANASLLAERDRYREALERLSKRRAHPESASCICEACVARRALALPQEKTPRCGKPINYGHGEPGDFSCNLEQNHRGECRHLGM